MTHPLPRRARIAAAVGIAALGIVAMFPLLLAGKRGVVPEKAADAGANAVVLGAFGVALELFLNPSPQWRRGILMGLVFAVIGLVVKLVF